MINDEELQKNIESGDHTNLDSVDAEAYRSVFKSLKKETSFNLPSDFASRVVNMAMNKSESKRDSRWLIAGIVSMVCALLFAFKSVNFVPRVGVFTFLSGYSGLVIFGIVFVVGLHIIDKMLIRKNRVDA